MCSEQQLKQATKEFFDRYWKSQNGTPPEWSKHWYFDVTIPNHDKKGCYALYSGEEIMYIGSGLSSYNFLYGGGLEARLNSYYKFNKDKQDPKKYKPKFGWGELTSIQTITFDNEHYYLAAALKIFLIEQLKPKRNLVYYD
jgi:hypothetical protein